MIDRLETAILALEDFGIDVHGPHGPLRVLIDEELPDAQLGLSRGAMAQTLMRALPSATAALEPGDVLTTADDQDWIIYEIVPEWGNLTWLRVNAHE
ncbi:hypothetical protein [Desulfuromonas thiophila]|uniref:hypothetical protein n=1 Tax=Desulfuromonas thiophila TaxID=57664 RepID=UPI0029F52C66|nr:hypothetical protein [Desulfuromonas thiophila]